MTQVADCTLNQSSTKPGKTEQLQNHEQNSDKHMKTSIVRATILLPVLTVMTGCIPSPRELETTPVKVQTPKGIVTCQLYRQDRVDWDRAIDFPATKMSVPEADAYCQQEGQRRVQR